MDSYPELFLISDSLIYMIHSCISNIMFRNAESTVAFLSQMLPLQPVFVSILHIIYDIFPILTIARELGRIVYFICLILLIATEFGYILYFICLILLIATEFGNILYFICPILLIASEFRNILYSICPILLIETNFGNILYFICLILQDAIEIGKIFSQVQIYVLISATRIEREFSIYIKKFRKLSYSSAFVGPLSFRSNHVHDILTAF